MIIDNSKTVDLAPLKAKIAKLESQINGFDFNLPANLAAKANVESILDDPAAFVAQLSDDNSSAKADWEIYNFYSAQSELKGYLESLAADLVKVSTRYLVSDTKALVSPAGFSVEDRVFIQPAIAIHADHLGGLPRSNVKLYGHDVDAMVADRNA